MSAISFIDTRPDQERAQWVKAFETVVAELSLALAKGGTIFQLSGKQIETPEGQIPYAEVLCILKIARTKTIAKQRRASGGNWRQKTLQCAKPGKSSMLPKCREHEHLEAPPMRLFTIPRTAPVTRGAPKRGKKAECGSGRSQKWLTLLCLLMHLVADV